MSYNFNCMKKGIIYKCKNLINNKVYIGQTIQNFNNRINRHRRDSINKKTISKFHNSLLKYGFNNFCWEILLETDIQNLDYFEEYYIKYYDSVEKGYNILKGGRKTNRGKDHHNYDSNVYTFYNVDGTIISLTMNEFYTKYNLDKSNVRNMILGKYPFYKNWSIDINNLPKTYSFINENGIKEINITRKDFYNKYNLNSGNIHSLTTGKLKTVKGWKLLK